MNWAELRDLVEHLPEDSATKAAEAGDYEGRRWTQQTYIGAATYNSLLLMIQVLWAAHLKGKPPELKTIDPPRSEADREAEERAEALAAHSEALLNSFSPGQAQTDEADIEHWQTKIRELEAAQHQ
ncbi:hypothetical protein [Streptomyces sp. NPDC005953]|uniref:hypothetical protein n=1 Tax=Streptomyces sp. NPDC005953 TaxID=3156719 RepID=UPI00340D4D33